MLTPALYLPLRFFFDPSSPLLLPRAPFKKDASQTAAHTLRPYGLTAKEGVTAAGGQEFISRIVSSHLHWQKGYLPTPYPAVFSLFSSPCAVFSKLPSYSFNCLNILVPPIIAAFLVLRQPSWIFWTGSLKRLRLHGAI